MKQRRRRRKVRVELVRAVELAELGHLVEALTRLVDQVGNHLARLETVAAEIRRDREERPPRRRRKVNDATPNPGGHDATAAD